MSLETLEIPAKGRCEGKSVSSDRLIAIAPTMTSTASDAPYPRRKPVKRPAVRKPARGNGGCGAFGRFG